MKRGSFLKRMRYRYFFIVLFFPFCILAQDGGQDAFMFIDIEHSPRVEALGGNAIAIYDNDVALSHTVPSLLNSSMDHDVAFTFGDYFSDISLFSFSYARDIDEMGVIGIALRAIHYGDFERTNADGYSEGSFIANDQVLTIGLGRRLTEKLSIGANVNFLNSNYDIYHSLALSSNISLTYFHLEKNFTSTLLVKNIGRQLDVYIFEQESLPYEIQFAISKELKYLPFRYHLVYNNINKFNISSPYKLISQTNPDTGELEIKDESIAKTALRHIIIGGELNPFRKSFFIRAGFNFQRRFDLTNSSMPAMVGFSWGIGFRVSKYYFDYSRSSYHLSATPNNFSIAANLSTFGL